MQVNKLVNIQLPFATGGDAPLTYALSPNLPTGLSFFTQGALLKITGRAQAASVYNGTLTVTDSDNPANTATCSIMLTMQTMAPAIEAAPVFPNKINAFTVVQGTTKTITLEAATGSNINYSLKGAPSWITSVGTHQYQLSPTRQTSPTVYPVIYEAANKGGSDQQTITIQVDEPDIESPPSAAPVFADNADGFSVEQGTVKRITLDAAIGSSVLYSLVGKPAWVVPISTRVWELRPAENTPAVVYQFLHRAANSSGKDEQVIVVSVTQKLVIIKPDKKPVFTVRGFNINVNAGDPVNIILPSARGGDGILTYRLENETLLQGLSRSGSLISGTAMTAGQQFSSPWIARDEDGDEVSIPFSIRVNRALSSVRNLKGTEHPLITRGLIVTFDEPSSIPTGITIMYRISIRLDRSGTSWQRFNLQATTSKIIYGLLSGERYFIEVYPMAGSQKGPVATISATVS